MVKQGGNASCEERRLFYPDLSRSQENNNPWAFSIICLSVPLDQYTYVCTCNWCGTHVRHKIPVRRSVDIRGTIKCNREQSGFCCQKNLGSTVSFVNLGKIQSPPVHPFSQSGNGENNITYLTALYGGLNERKSHRLMCKRCSINGSRSWLSAKTPSVCSFGRSAYENGPESSLAPSAM